MAADRPQGLLAYMDEMKSWADNLTNPKTSENRSSWVKGYNAERALFDRVGDGSINIEHFALSMLGNMQPKVLRHNIDALGTDGLIQRFVFAILREEYMEKLDDPSVEITTTPEWEMLIRKIAALPPMEYMLSQDAYIAFREFQEWLMSITVS